ncbi:MAG: adenylate/guanylate cyclase domain-containing protein [Bdellovibrionaceae bacterium]|nr:adenylate/guanylate cyclase domain-containing protein [Pseudobdellovibrionaceae bacterium]MDW8191104.1 adenylate/guanylate cyclase domain-containing protein [Pseudobdellovibrionaceae bacterium]
MRIPLSIKLVVVTMVLVVSVTVTVAFIASMYFEDTARKREESINLDMVTSKGLVVQSELNRLIHDLLLAGKEVYSDTTRAGASRLTEINSAVEFIAIFDVVGQLRKEHWYNERPFFDDHQRYKVINKSLFTHFVQNPEQEYLLDVVTKSGDKTIVLLYLPFSKNVRGYVDHVLVAGISDQFFQNIFKEPGERFYFLLTHQGKVIFHSMDYKFFGQNFETHPIYALAQKTQKMASGQRLISDSFIGQKVYSAYFKTSQGILVVSEVPEKIVQEPAQIVKYRIFYIGGIVVALSILLAFVFSLSITMPIEKLASLMELVKKGIFDIYAQKNVKTIFDDEVKDLAKAVDQMTEGLKERDKVKNLFNKFVSSSITEDLLKREVALGGKRTDVVIFFSDIRGFTAMSESLPPEEVVEILNTYFQVMVKIINASGGIVDKFIGDSIMAVWGIPHPRPDDAERALKACLSMRKALVEVNQKLIKNKKNPLWVGMGLNLGSVVAGTIGSEERMEYTVVGNAVNTASRIEAATKACGADLLVSEEIYEKCQSRFLMEIAAEVQVKGRSVPLRLYKVLGYVDPQGRDIHVVKTPYSEFKPEMADKVQLKSNLG